MQRRRLIGVMVNLAGAAIAGTIAVPGMIALFGPARKSGPAWRPLGPLQAFPIGQVRQALVSLDRDDGESALQVQGVYVWRPSEDEVTVYSRSCTDLGCPVTHDPGSGWFYCPCHGGIFDEDGERRAGPPNKPLYRYAWRLTDGVLEIDLRSVPPMV